MAPLVLYYSNTGNTRRVAQALAEEIGGDLAEIICPAYRKWFSPVVMA